MGQSLCSDACCRSEESARGEYQFRAAALAIWCDILTAVSGGGGVATNVNVLSVLPGIGALNLGKAEDSVHASGDVGVEMLARRADTASSSSTTDGDYSTLNTDATGRLWAHADIVSALPAGAAIIGKVGIDQTTPGTTNAVALTAGSAIIGNVRIDQTTPGTTNGVQVNAALPAGSNIVGNVRIDQTTLGTTNGMSSVASTTGGYTPTRTSLSTTVTALKSSAQGKLGGWSIYNPNNLVAFVQVFNVATFGAVTLGTTVPVLTFGIPPFGAAIGNAGAPGIDFSAGIQIAATTTATGNTAPTAPLETTFWWK